MEVVDGKNCPNGQDPVFFKEWKGTELGCVHTDGSYGGSKNNKWRIYDGEGYAETYYDYDVFDNNGTHKHNDDKCGKKI